MTSIIKPNDFGALWACVRDDARKALDEVGASGHWILGPAVARLEASVASLFGLRRAVGCASGLDAIEIALRSLDLGPGELVITTPLSAFASTLAILRAGGVPWFVDVDDSGLLDLDAVEEVVRQERARWLLPVHLYGHAIDLKRLRSLKQQYGLRIVEDCAQAIGARSSGITVGTVGDAAATSFYPTKNLGGIGDGGLMVTDEAVVAAKARALRDYGQQAKYEHVELGLNSRLDELQAALLEQAFLPHLSAFTARRVEIAGRYRREITSSAITIPPMPEHSESVWHLFPVLVDSPERLMSHLEARGIISARHYPFLIPEQKAMRSISEVRSSGPLTHARRFATQEVSLPIHPFLSTDDINRVVAACNEL